MTALKSHPQDLLQNEKILILLASERLQSSIPLPRANNANVNNGALKSGYTDIPDADYDLYDDDYLTY